MRKIEIVYRYLIERILADKKTKFVGREIARELGISPNTISNAIAPLKRSGAADVHKRYFEVTNLEKTLAYWAVNRQLEKDIVYKTYVAVKNVDEIEKRMPSEIAYTCCSGYKNIFGNDVSDYGKVYVYAAESALIEIKRRFPERRLSAKVEGSNLFVLSPDSILESMILSGKLEHSSVQLSQLYVDLWNTSEWYSYEFLKRLGKKIDDKYGEIILE
jgi:biotin operon repressor